MFEINEIFVKKEQYQSSIIIYGFIKWGYRNFVEITRIGPKHQPHNVYEVKFHKVNWNAYNSSPTEIMQLASVVISSFLKREREGKTYSFCCSVSTRGDFHGFAEQIETTLLSNKICPSPAWKPWRRRNRDVCFKTTRRRRRSRNKIIVTPHPLVLKVGLRTWIYERYTYRYYNFITRWELVKSPLFL